VFSERELVDAFTGMVVDGIAIESDQGATSTACERCGLSLSAGDPVTVTLSYYEGHTWEPTGTYCMEHPARSVESAMGVDAEDQAVIEATLERTGYLDPTGTLHPDALTVGGVVVIDYSPAAAGYD